MPTFTPGWNVSTIIWLMVGVLGVVGAVSAAFVTARYSLLGKVLDAQEGLSKRAEDRADKTTARFDTLESKLHMIEGELNASRNETLAARQEVLVLRQENVELQRQRGAVEEELVQMRFENKRLSGECENLKRQIALLKPPGEVIDIA